ncbi:6-phosphogluconate dehydrogenase [Streptosporangium jomthongense]|uniref:Phosphogluconate dehydrogenase (NAD(+)-dependent, decarboxylating) n=1 Tax=Marinobacter aromaticivorans TaxID=1494078 RepID=A0ABW2ITH6_9GAMM|nr:decarboxylating 6-phosphogluconate dehydrogenase [Marinobacter aromaticivorans]GGE59091.1 6-phosphogluconate dehydrogenase [Streptosporangium jomthongense]
MQIGIIGLGRMGGNMAQCLMAAGHDVVVHDGDAAALERLAALGAEPAQTLDRLVECLTKPRVVWLMVPATAVANVITTLSPLLRPRDILVDGGNSYYRDTHYRAAELAEKGIAFVDVGVSGGIWGRDHGYCLMIGGADAPVTRLVPLFRALASGIGGGIEPKPSGNDMDTAGEGYLHCGPPGAGHYVKMAHNAIEYVIMAAYAEGFELLRHASHEQQNSGERSAFCDDPQAIEYDFDLAKIARLWRQGSVIRSWLLDLASESLNVDPSLTAYDDRVADSGEGRWALRTAIETEAATPLLAQALFQRFTSRDHGRYANRLLSAMRNAFGGHGAG